MGMHVLAYLKHTLKRKDKSRDADWDFGARQSPDVSTRRDSIARRRRSSSLDRQRCPPPAPRAEVPQQQHKRISAAVGDSSIRPSLRASRVDVPADTGPGANGPRSASPEDDVLLAAGESAKESRSATKPGENRRRAHSVAITRLSDPSVRPVLRHATSAFTARDISASPSTPSAVRSMAASPAPSVQSFRSVQAGPSDSSRRVVLAAKRSMPQLHNVWENFLEEAAEDADSFDFPMPPRSPPRPQSPIKYASVHSNSRTGGSRHPGHLHAPTASSSLSAASSSATLSPARGLPRSPHPHSSQSHPPSSSNRLRPRGHVRASHQTSSSTSSATTSNAGSTSSMAAFSSASSMTTAFEGSDDGLHARDGPTPQSTASTSPRTFKIVDPSLSPLPSLLQRKLLASPSPQFQDLPRGVSPTSSTSSDSCSTGTVPYAHSQSTTPTPSSNCPTPSPSPSRCGPPPMSPSKQAGRLSPEVSAANRQFRRSPDAELLEHPLSPGSPKGGKSYRHSSAAAGYRVEVALRSPLEVREDRKNYEEDVLSELGYYGSMSSRAKSGQRSSVHTFSASSPQSPTPSGMPVVPPPRRSSRKNLRAVASRSVPSVHVLSLPRAKSASNIKHDTRTALERPCLSPVRSSNPLLTTNTAVSSGLSSVAPGNPRLSQSRPFTHSRSQTFQHDQLLSLRDPNASVENGNNSSVPVVSTSRPGQMGRMRSGSASMVYTQRLSNAQAPVRPPPAPPLDLTPSRLQPPKTGKESTSASPLTPASAVQWGFAL